MRFSNTLVVWRLNHLARSMKQFIEAVEGPKGRQIGLRPMTKNMGTTTSGGKFVIHIFGAPTEIERSILQERTRSGLAHVAEPKGARM